MCRFLVFFSPSNFETMYSLTCLSTIFSNPDLKSSGFFLHFQWSQNFFADIVHYCQEKKKTHNRHSQNLKGIPKEKANTDTKFEGDTRISPTKNLSFILSKRETNELSPPKILSHQYKILPLSVSTQSVIVRKYRFYRTFG